jgi:hypothetical protein
MTLPINLTTFLNSFPIDNHIRAIAWSINEEEEVVAALVSNDDQMSRVHDFFLRQFLPNRLHQFICVREPNYNVAFVESFGFESRGQPLKPPLHFLCVFERKPIQEQNQGEIRFRTTLQFESFNSPEPELNLRYHSGWGHPVTYAQIDTAEAELDNQISNLSSRLMNEHNQLLYRYSIAPIISSVFDNQETERVLYDIGEREIRKMKQRLTRAPAPLCTIM